MNKQNIAKLVSTIFNPLWIGTTAFLFLIFYEQYSLSVAIQVLSSAIISTVFLPVAILSWFAARGKTANIDIPEREKRLLPFFIFTVIYFLDAVINYYLRLPQLFQSIIWIILINTIIYGIITVWWKVSIHAAGIAGYIVTVLYIYNHLLLWPLLIIIAVSWSRVVLQAHTRLQVTVGSILGIFLTYSQLWLYNEYLF